MSQLLYVDINFNLCCIVDTICFEILWPYDCLI